MLLKYVHGCRFYPRKVDISGIVSDKHRNLEWMKESHAAAVAKANTRGDHTLRVRHALEAERGESVIVRKYDGGHGVRQVRKIRSRVWDTQYTERERERETRREVCTHERTHTSAYSCARMYVPHKCSHACKPVCVHTQILESCQIAECCCGATSADCLFIVQAIWQKMGPEIQETRIGEDGCETSVNVTDVSVQPVHAAIDSPLWNLRLENVSLRGIRLFSIFFVRVPWSLVSMPLFLSSGMTSACIVCSKLVRRPNHRRNLYAQTDEQTNEYDAIFFLLFDACACARKCPYSFSHTFCGPQIVSLRDTRKCTYAIPFEFQSGMLRYVLEKLQPGNGMLPRQCKLWKQHSTHSWLRQALLSVGLGPQSKGTKTYGHTCQG